MIRVVAGLTLRHGVNDVWVGANPVVLSVGDTVSHRQAGVWLEVDEPTPGESSAMSRITFDVVRSHEAIPADGRYLGTARADVTAPPLHVFIVEAPSAPGAPVPVVDVADSEVVRVEPYRPSAAAVRPRWGRPFRQGLNAGGRVV